MAVPGSINEEDNRNGVMIQIKDIYKTYELGNVSVKALDGVSLNIAENEFVAIMGPSGSGKSTLMHVLGLLDKPDAGSYLLNGQEVSKLSDKELAGLRNEFLGFVFQQFNLLPRMTALENVALPRVYTKNAHLKDTERETVALLNKVGLGQRTKHKTNELSGGQQQRVAVARSLINNPLLILADEPTGNLDSHSTKEILDLLKSLNESGITIIMVTHEDELAENASRILRLRDGKIVSDETRRPPAAASGAAAARREKAAVIPVPGTLHSNIIGLLRIRDYFTQAFRALVSNKTRSALSILGVLIGVAAVIAMLALGTGAQEDVKKRLASLGSNLLVVRPQSAQRGGISLEAGAVTRLTLQDANEIREKVPDIKRIAPSVQGRGQVTFGGKNWNTRVLGTVPDYQYMHDAVPVSGRYFSPEETITRAKVAVIGKTVVDQLFGDKNPIGQFIKIKKINFQVIGILPTKGASAWRDNDDEVDIPLNTAMYRLLGKEYVDSVEVEVASAEAMENAQDAINKLVMTTHRIPSGKSSGVEIRNMADIQETVAGTARTFSYLLGSIAFISLLVGGIGIMNIMLVSVTERTREIGLRKAIGANNSDILMQFIIEAVTVCFTGGVCGILLGSAISLSLATFAGWSTRISAPSIFLAFLFSVAIGLVFGLWPARKASLLNPIEALRYE
jgi:macrolide transport system ATP-binding/permease protein